MGCEDPEALDVPISHWSHSEPARRAVARGTVAKPLRADDERQAADDVRPREEGWDLPSRTRALSPSRAKRPDRALTLLAGRPLSARAAGVPEEALRALPRRPFLIFFPTPRAAVGATFCFVEARAVRPAMRDEKASIGRLRPGPLQSVDLEVLIARYIKIGPVFHNRRLDQDVR